MVLLLIFSSEVEGHLVILVPLNEHRMVTAFGEPWFLLYDNSTCYSSAPMHALFGFIWFGRTLLGGVSLNSII